MCLKPRMDYGLPNAVILLTNKPYITLARRLRGGRHFHMQPGSQANTQLLAHLHEVLRSRSLCCITGSKPEQIQSELMPKGGKISTA